MGIGKLNLKHPYLNVVIIFYFLFCLPSIWELFSTNSNRQGDSINWLLRENSVLSVIFASPPDNLIDLGIRVWPTSPENAPLTKSRMTTTAGLVETLILMHGSPCVVKEQPSSL